MVDDYSIRNEFSIYNAQDFLKSVSTEKMYIFVGKTSEWPDENDAPTPTSSEQMMINAWDNMILTKRISSANMSLAIKRYNWTSGTTYIPWDSEDGLMREKRFYVITHDNRVYKCLDSIPNTPSTIEPTDTGITPVRLSDGYTWKFMYDLSSADLVKFNDTEVIPVKYLTQNDGSLQWEVQQYAIPGTINRIEVLNGGSGYTECNVEIEGDGTGASATVVLNNDGSVRYVIVTNTGQGYTWANVRFVGNGSVSAIGRVILSPIKGHGSNPVQELFGSNVISSVTFEGNEGGKFPIGIKFRQIGLIVNPYLYGTETVAELSGANQQYTTLSCSGISGTFVEGEYINIMSRSIANVAQIVKVDSSRLLVNVVKGEIQENDLIQGSTSGTSAEVINVSEPILQNYSGEMLYLENRSPISKIENQSETYRLVIKF